MENNAKIVELLLEFGADPTIKNNNDKYPLDLTNSEDVNVMLQGCGLNIRYVLINIIEAMIKAQESKEKSSSTNNSEQSSVFISQTPQNAKATKAPAKKLTITLKKT